jgi:hypothetical protein
MSRNSNILRRAFMVGLYIRSVVESMVCNPYLVHQINLLESFQRYFTKRMPSLSNFTHPERYLNRDAW